MYVNYELKISKKVGVGVVGYSRGSGRGGGR